MTLLLLEFSILENILLVNKNKCKCYLCREPQGAKIMNTCYEFFKNV